MPLKELFSVIGMLAGFGLILLLAWWSVKVLGRGYGATGPRRVIQVLDRVSLGADKQLLAVQAGGRVLLLGATAHHVELLAELDAGALPDPPPPAAQDGGFIAVLKNALEQKRKGEGGDEDGPGAGPGGPQAGSL